MEVCYMVKIPRSEHPRPNFQRSSWQSLNGLWDFSFDAPLFDKKILVPFVFESSLSGIGETDFHDIVWYKRTFSVPEVYKNQRTLLHFGAVDYGCTVMVNGKTVSFHEGGQVSFTVDITGEIMFDKENEVILRVFDHHADLEQPRGKQYWEEEPKSIFYTQSTGIWQSVWLEFVPASYVESVRITPLFDEKSVQFEYELQGDPNLSFESEIFFEGDPITTVCVKPNGLKGSFKVLLQNTTNKYWNFYEDMVWSPENPRLFDVVFTLRSKEAVVDTVASYFGMRKTSIENGMFLLNNKPYYQKLVLDQGYWEESLLTAPTDEAFVEDIELTKAMGFNGVRKHQKVEDPRYLYHADRLGLLVWAEIGSAYHYSVSYASRMYREWEARVLRDYNHPCIVTWVPLNESWGVQEIATSKRQQAHSCALVHMTKSLDETRPVICNDGWEHTNGDMLTVHDYEGEVGTFASHYKDLEALWEYRPAGKAHYVGGFSYSGEPVMVSEFGGIQCLADQSSESGKNWGYTSVNSSREFSDNLHLLFQALLKSKLVQGYCYTQLTDIGTETNGLLTIGRKPKLPLSVIRGINNGLQPDLEEK